MIDPKTWRQNGGGGPGTVVQREYRPLANGLRVGFYPPGAGTGNASATVENGIDAYHFGWSPRWGWYAWGGSTYGHASGMPLIARDWPSTNPERIIGLMDYRIAPPEWQELLDAVYPFSGGKGMPT